MDAKFSHAAAAKAVKYDVTTVEYWLKHWKQSKDLSNSIRSGRARATIPKQDERIVSRTEQQTIDIV